MQCDELELRLLVINFDIVQVGFEFSSVVTVRLGLFLEEHSEKS